MFGFGGPQNYLRKRVLFGALVVGLSLSISTAAFAQSWVWNAETVDTSGSATSLKVDRNGDVHLSYSGAVLKYAFRPADQRKWFAMQLDYPAHYTSLTLDSEGNPRVCATYSFHPLRYLRFNKGKWDNQPIGSDAAGIEYSCSIAIAPDGTPHLTWYKIGTDYLHLKYGVLKDEGWMVNTLDWDMQTGKWNSMVLDSKGNPYVSYDAFVKGLLKCAHWDGKNWKVQVVDSRGLRGNDYSIGMGSSIALDQEDNVRISYYTENQLRYASQQKNVWKIETVDSVSPNRSAHDYRSSLVFDKNGFPHISYEDRGAVKHAYWDGKRWRTQMIAPSGSVGLRGSSMAIDNKRNILYLSYQDGTDGSLKVATGSTTPIQQQANGNTRGKD